ncbi:MAG TPA: hypothetical protein VGE64_07785 [Xanthomonadaceae bacterium]
MTVVPEALRISELHQLGLSESLCRLSLGETVHQVFSVSCQGPPFYSYHGAWVPEGRQFLPLWDYSGTVCGIHCKTDGLEFVEYYIETPGEIRVISRTEQGFWAHQFDFLYECDQSIDDLMAAADLVGFAYLDFYLQSRTEAEEKLMRSEDKDAWIQKVIDEIDRDSIGKHLTP